MTLTAALDNAPKMYILQILSYRNKCKNTVNTQ